jgi:DNA polymerase III delta prime subunit
MEKKVHHANIVIGPKAKEKVLELLEKQLDFKVQGNPDFFVIEAESFGIDSARMLGEWSIMKPLLRSIKVGLVCAESVTLDAQNALLKLLEEPKEGTYIFIVIKNIGGIVPTLLSRVQLLHDDEGKSNVSVDAESFLKESAKGRLQMINAMSKISEKNEMRSLISELEKAAYEKKGNGPDEISKLKDPLRGKILSQTRGASPKMILEWLASVL